MKCNVSRDHCYSWWTNGHLWDHLIMLNGKLCEVVFFFFFLINITSLITSFLSRLSGKDTLELCVMSKHMWTKSHISVCVSVLPLTWSLVIHGQNLHFLQRVKSWPEKEVHILNEFLPWILISQSKGFFLQSSLPFL